MASFVYAGMTDKEKAALVKAKFDGMHPQDKRGQPLRYTIKADDAEDRKEEKRKNVAEWKAARKKEIVADVEGLAAVRVIHGVKFEAGKPVKVEDGSLLDLKLRSMAETKGCPFRLVDEPKKADGKPKE